MDHIEGGKHVFNFWQLESRYNMTTLRYKLIKSELNFCCFYHYSEILLPAGGTNAQCPWRPAVLTSGSGLLLLSDQLLG